MKFLLLILCMFGSILCSFKYFYNKQPISYWQHMFVSSSHYIKMTQCFASHIICYLPFLPAFKKGIAMLSIFMPLGVKNKM